MFHQKNSEMNLFENERKFVSNSTDKEWISNWWDELFETFSQNMGTFTKFFEYFNQNENGIISNWK